MKGRTCREEYTGISKELCCIGGDTRRVKGGLRVVVQPLDRVGIIGEICFGRRLPLDLAPCLGYHHLATSSSEVCIQFGLHADFQFF